MIEFTVAPPSRGDPSPTPGAVLQQDNWNDFSFNTQYHLYLFIPEFSGLIGTVKILKLGQTESDSLQLQVGQLARLGEEFCSLGQNLDYYERLAGLPAKVRDEILTFLRDALTFPGHAESFSGEPGWRISVLRDIDWESFRSDASVLLDRDYDRVAKLGLDLAFYAKDWNDPLRLSFNGPNNDSLWFVGSSRAKLPERIAVLTGRNGSGKSTLLARLARILHASQRDRGTEELQLLGRIEPPGIGFTRVLTFAYSAFDTFQVPGVDTKERRQIIEDLDRGTGRYYFSGLRDISRELREGLAEEDDQADAPNPAGRDRQQKTLLKSAEQLAAEFERTVKHIWAKERHDLFRRVLSVLASDPSFPDAGPEPASLISQAPAELFASWSAGHKIVMHAAASLAAYTEAKSIVLIDEPESHLHPPLLAAFMHAVRLILDAKDAFAVVATHSPIVAQETLGRHISVVRRKDSEVTIRPPNIETYGESIGEITDEVFGLNSDATDFHRTLQALIEAGMSLETIEALFDRGLSLQARAYVMSELARKE